jgi:Eco57I restriction-modification methylase
LGYEYKPEFKELNDESMLPVLGEIKKPSGAPELWILEALDLPDDENGESQKEDQQDRGEVTGDSMDSLGYSGDSVDPLAVHLRICQLENDSEPNEDLLSATFDDLITKSVFGRNEPPRWVILASDTQLVLLDRGKWNEKRLLRFDLSEILGRRETTTLQALAALLHRDSVCPEEGMSLLDSLDENSHKHAHAVSEDLKYALREAIELLGNEVIYYTRNVLKSGVFDDQEGLNEKQLTIECLRYMYRLLFLFYIEARPELGYAPMKATAYRMGYSLESLREIELVKLTTEEAKNGYFLHESLQLLFDIIYNGFQPRGEEIALALDLDDKPQYNTFQLTPLRTHLFDPKRTELINKVKIRNSELQKIIELMSLSRAKTRKDRRGRVSYAQLGINQLGAVYEALLSFSGFFAKTDLYEVQKEGERHDELETAYFVKENDLPKYTDGEKVFNKDGSLKKYDKGTFIYRLAGRDRQKSASYYTPEVLTQCLVKYALKELLGEKPGDKNWKSADEILHLTVCEPAMGSAAFLNEAINQLSEAYLDRKQKELGDRIPHDEYAQERQKVKTYIADNNVFGVDLNPVAVELAEVSLWLNTIFEGGFVPWFGNQLSCGNSLVGARRQVFDAKLLGTVKKGEKSWLNSVPERVMPGKKRPKNAVYHFLAPDLGMANYTDKVIKKLAPKEIDAIHKWRKEFCKPFSKGETETLLKLSDAIDRLWDKHTEQQHDIRLRTTDALHVFGQPASKDSKPNTTTEWKDKVLYEELYSENVRNSSPYRRLKMVMDYWCALWFWPIQKAELLPTREEYLFDLSLLLEGDVMSIASTKDEQIPLFADTQPEQLAMQMVDDFGFVNVDKLCEKFERLALVHELGREKYRYLHWELEFADLFKQHGGFDLVVGNPPWIRVEWKEADLLCEYLPIIELRKMSAKEIADHRQMIIDDYRLFHIFVSSYGEFTANKNYLTSAANYPFLLGLKANLYKCFITSSWGMLSRVGQSAFLAYEGVYTDPSGGMLRKACYSRLQYLFGFQNEQKLFRDVGNAKRFEMVGFGQEKSTPKFNLLTTLFHPITIDDSYSASGLDKPLPRIKDDNGKWNIMGHKNRLVEIGLSELKLFAKLYDPPGTDALQARLPDVYSKSVISVLRNIASYNHSLGSCGYEWHATGMWNETYSKEDGILIPDNDFPETPAGWVFSGPHFGVGNPYFQTPNRKCDSHRAYSPIDLVDIGASYLPRSKYRPAKIDLLQSHIPKVKWRGSSGDALVTKYYRMINREMIGPQSERTFIAAIMPKEAGHLKSCVSTCFYNTHNLLDFYSMAISIVTDFTVKSTGLSHANISLLKQLPIVKAIDDSTSYRSCLHARALLLTCISEYYSELWKQCFSDNLQNDNWAKNDVRLKSNIYKDLSETWNSNYAVRTSFARRQVLVEIDVLSAMEMDVSLSELKDIYRIQFPVLNLYEKHTWYDQLGNIVFTNNKSLTNVGLSRKEWEIVKGKDSGVVESVVDDDTIPGGPRKKGVIYHAPFDRCDREHDYEVAWKEFEKRYGKVRSKK